MEVPELKSHALPCKHAPVFNPLCYFDYNMEPQVLLMKAAWLRSLNLWTTSFLAPVQFKDVQFPQPFLENLTVPL